MTQAYSPKRDSPRPNTADRPVNLPSDDYDAQKDIEGCFNEAYRVIRERMANGGPGWEPK